MVYSGVISTSVNAGRVCGRLRGRYIQFKKVYDVPVKPVYLGQLSESTRTQSGSPLAAA